MNKTHQKHISFRKGVLTNSFDLCNGPTDISELCFFMFIFLEIGIANDSVYQRRLDIPMKICEVIFT